MTKLLFAALLTAVTIPALPTPVQAGSAIERACLSGGRRAASRELCSCIQSVADQVLSGTEQRKGAKFFADPHKSQETRQSDHGGDEVFWEKWKSFGATAHKHCG
ncbi:MAG: hypothetical protein ACRBCL_06410 [Maritimibacter sp.]